MRIIAGLAKGMMLVAPKAIGVRPTADRIREAIFSSLGESVGDARVLDLFAGTGAIGLEAASRGAAAVTFVENARGALECLEQNVGEFTRRIRDRNVVSTIFDIMRGDVPATLGRITAESHGFSLIFADPPYGEGAQELLCDEHLPRLLADDGHFVLESAKRAVLSVRAPWQLVREAVYGDTRVSFLRREPATSADRS